MSTKDIPYNERVLEVLFLITSVFEPEEWSRIYTKYDVRKADVEAKYFEIMENVYNGYGEKRS